MARKWSELRAKMPPEARARADRKAEAMLMSIALRDLLHERGFTQAELAERLDLAQGNVSRALRRTDMHVSTLRDIVEAMGGSLEITARFPDGEYRIDRLAPRDADFDDAMRAFDEVGRQYRDTLKKLAE